MPRSSLGSLESAHSNFSVENKFSRKLKHCWLAVMMAFRYGESAGLGMIDSFLKANQISKSIHRKTQCAVEYSHLRLAQRRGPVIWIDARTPATIKQSTEA